VCGLKVPILATCRRRASRQDAETAIGWRRVRAKVLARRGEPAEGERLAREAIALAARTDYLHYHAQAVADLAEVLRLSGRSKESAAVAKEAIRLYEKKGEHRRSTGAARLPGGAGRRLETGATGLEPATSGVTGRRSNQLNYAPWAGQV
jgi:hypothetical protein